MINKKHIAIIYDFDGTLAPGNMQERDFIPAIGMKTKQFWNEVNDSAKKHQADNILAYMKLMLDKAQQASVPVRKNDFHEYGKNLCFFKGILPDNSANDKGWFEKINQYAHERNMIAEHYIVSSGIREMIEGCPLAAEFTMIYASSFMYDHNGVAVWPALAINYTTKTQYLFRINKGCLDVSDNASINKTIPENERPIPFSHMIYLGDGETDIPAFRLVKDKGGCAIAVYKPNTKGAKEKMQHLILDGRVNHIAPADYRTNTPIDKIVKDRINELRGK